MSLPVYTGLALPAAGVPNVIQVDSGIRESVSQNGGPEATVRFQMLWSDRYAFANNVLGRSISLGDLGIIRTPPLQYPPSPNLYAMEVSEIGGIGQPRGAEVGTSTGWLSYALAYVVVRFARPTWSFDTSDPSGVPWTTTSLNISGEFLTFPDTAYTFAGGVSTGTPIGRVIPQMEISFKRHWVPFLPVDQIIAIVGTVNDDEFFGCPSETLLFNGAATTRSTDSFGNSTQEVEYKFTYRPINWNMFAKPDGSGFDYVGDSGGGTVYQLGDFTTLP